MKTNLLSFLPQKNEIVHQTFVDIVKNNYGENYCDYILTYSVTFESGSHYVLKTETVNQYLNPEMFNLLFNNSVSTGMYTLKRFKKITHL